ncbi:MAG: hypothetical protein ACYS4T_20125, partial [Planctomycetota bacterium]
KLSGEIMLKLIITEDKRSEAFAVFCDQLSGLASQVHITKKKSETEQKPAIQVKGDILYILGETGDQNITSELENVTQNSNNPELQETAREAVMKIWERRH